MARGPKTSRRDYVDRMLAVQRGVRKLETTAFGDPTAIAPPALGHPHPVAEWLAFPTSTPGEGWYMGPVAARLWAAERRCTQKDIHRLIAYARKRLGCIDYVGQRQGSFADPRTGESLKTTPNGYRWDQQFGQGEASEYILPVNSAHFAHTFVFPRTYDAPSFSSQLQYRAPVGFDFSSSVPDDTWDTPGGPSMTNYSWGAYYYAGPGIPAVDPSGAAPAGAKFSFVQTNKGYNANPALYGSWVPDETGWAGTWFAGGTGWLPGFSMGGFTDGKPSAPGFTFSYDDNQMRLNVGPGEWEFGQASSRVLLPPEVTGRTVGGVGVDATSGRPYSRPTKRLTFPFIREYDLRVAGPPVWWPSEFGLSDVYTLPSWADIPKTMTGSSASTPVYPRTWANVVANYESVLGMSMMSALAAWVSDVLSHGEAADSYEHAWQAPSSTPLGPTYPSRVYAARVGNTVAMRGMTQLSYGNIVNHFWADKRLAVRLPNGGSSMEVHMPRNDGAAGTGYLRKSSTGLSIDLLAGVSCDSLVFPALYPDL